MSLLNRIMSLFKENPTVIPPISLNQSPIQQSEYTSYVPKGDINEVFSTNNVPIRDTSSTPLQDIEEISLALEAQNRRYNRDLTVG